MKVLSQSTLGPFHYERFESFSPRLNRPCPWGRVRVEGMTDSVIEGTIYFFHGADGDDQQFVASGILESLDASALRHLTERRLQVVLAHIGTSFLHDHPERAQSSYYGYFTEELIPAAEARTRTHAASRYVVGISMGGHASLSAFFRNPEQFAGVGALAPALVAFDFTSSSAIEQYAHRVGRPLATIEALSQLMRSEFRDHGDYQAQDPLHLAREMDGASLARKRIVMECGDQDAFGFNASTEELGRILQQKSAGLRSSLAPGEGHDLEYAKRGMPRILEGLLG